MLVEERQVKASRAVLYRLHTRRAPHAHVTDPHLVRARRPSAYSHPGATTMTSVPRGPRPANLARSSGISTVTQARPQAGL